jgi:hypothetical protein
MRLNPLDHKLSYHILRTIKFAEILQNYFIFGILTKIYSNAYKDNIYNRIVIEIFR